MARQIGPIKITGTIDGITFYRMDGVYYARMKSSLTAKKVKTHPNFALTRMYANWLGEASKIASEAYRSLPKEERKYELFCELKKLAHKRVKEGVEREVILKELKEYLIQLRLSMDVSTSFAPLCGASRSLRFSSLTAKNAREAQRSAKGASRHGLSCLLPSAFYLSPSGHKGRRLTINKCLLVKDGAGYYIYADPACV